jgi:glycosyltransferase involved in cell wall biosynthesis
MDPLYLLFHGELAHGVVMVYDTTPLTHPEWHGAATSRLYSAALKMLARSSCHVVTCSKHTSDELRVNHAIVPSRLTVLPLGPLTSTCNQSHGAESRPANEAPFLLFVGNIEPRKNVAGLVRAFNKADLFRTCGVRLRIIGTICDPKDRAVIEAHSTAGVDVLGFVDDATLAASYRDCLGFIYPSFCEGFGIPLLEAMSAGCVCLATSAGASPEVGGDAVLYVNPHDDDAIAAGMLRVLNMCDADRRALRERSKQRAQTFTWERFYDGLSGVLIKEAERCFAGSGVSYCGAAV